MASSFNTRNIIYKVKRFEKWKQMKELGFLLAENIELW